jgi:ketosteroid isomerase-like protein
VDVIEPMNYVKEGRMNRSNKLLNRSEILILIAMAGCQLAPASGGSQPILSSTDVITYASAFETVAQAQVDAWNKRDNPAIHALYHPDAVMYDRTFGDHGVGIDAIVAILNNMTVVVPKWKALSSGWYIGKDGGLSIDPLWDLAIGGQAFTQSDLLIDVDWMHTKNGLISDWTVFYGLDALGKMNTISAERMTQSKSLLAAYESAWSGDNANVVGDLYASDAVREDSLFGKNQQGREAILSFVKSFFAWHPGTAWILSLPFGEGQGDAPIAGGLFSILVKDTRGQPCAVKAGVLLQAADGKIIHETIYYEADSLIQCGWAR